MVLSGADSKTRLDDKAPYALFGDNGSGAYYSWSAGTGAYTVKSRPFAGTKDKMGSATGSTYTVSFSIVK